MLRRLTLLLLLLPALIAAAQARIDTISVATTHIASPAKAVVATPGGAGPYPTVYLLHGYTGTYSDWAKAAPLADIAAGYGVVIVCPDGRDSWYWDSPIDPAMQMESFITRSLVPAVDSLYPTIRRPAARAITGLSMGGHGALWLALRHPEIWSAAGSMSGLPDITLFPERYKMKQRLSSYQANPARWRAHSVMSLVDKVPQGTAIIFDCGEQDPFVQSNRTLHRALSTRGVPHTFSTRPGAHTWTYWATSLPTHIQFFKNHFDAYQQHH